MQLKKREETPSILGHKQHANELLMCIHTCGSRHGKNNLAEGKKHLRGEAGASSRETLESSKSKRSRTLKYSASRGVREWRMERGSAAAHTPRTTSARRLIAHAFMKQRAKIMLSGDTPTDRVRAGPDAMRAQGGRRGRSCAVCCLRIFRFRRQVSELYV